MSSRRGTENRHCRRRQSAVAASGEAPACRWSSAGTGLACQFRSVRALCRPARRRRSAPLPAPHSDADAGLVMIHTAAVGGRPRGALLSHANLIAASAQLLHYWSLTPDDVNLGVLPLFHVAGLGMLLAAQHAGGASIIVPKFDAGTALDVIHRQRVTMLAEFPPILTTLLDAAEIRPTSSRACASPPVSTARRQSRASSACARRRASGRCSDNRKPPAS